MKRDVVCGTGLGMLDNREFMPAGGIKKLQNLRPTIEMLVVVTAQSRCALFTHVNGSLPVAIPEWPARGAVLNRPNALGAIECEPTREHQAHKSLVCLCERQQAGAHERPWPVSSVSVSESPTSLRQRWPDASASRPSNPLAGLTPAELRLPAMFCQRATRTMSDRTPATESP